MQTTPSSAFKLSLATPEQIAEGVIVKNINLPSQIDKKPPFQGSLFDVLPGCTSPIDQHAVAECWCIVKGQGALTYDGQTVRANPQEIFYFESHKAHQITNDRNETLTILSLYW